MTAAVWAECVAWSDKEELPQDESTRLWDVLWMAAQAARSNRKSSADRLVFELCVMPRGGRQPKRRSLVLHIGPGDDGEAAMAIMVPGED